MGVPTPIIFPDWLHHVNVSIALAHLGKPVSAGHVKVDWKGGRAITSGKSVGLELKPHKLDDGILSDALTHPSEELL